MFLLEASLHDELVGAVDGPAGPELGEQEGEQMLRLPVKHLGDLGEISERGLLGAHAHHLTKQIQFI